MGCRHDANDKFIWVDRCRARKFFLHVYAPNGTKIEINFKEKSFMDAVKIEGNPLPGKIQVDYDGELLVGQSILLNGKNLTRFSRYKIFDFVFKAKKIEVEIVNSLLQLPL